MTSPDITMLLNRMWKELSPEDRNFYDDKAASCLEQHKVEKVKWDIEHLEKVNTENVNRATEALPEKRVIFREESHSDSGEHTVGGSVRDGSNDIEATVFCSRTSWYLEDQTGLLDRHCTYSSYEWFEIFLFSE